MKRAMTVISVWIIYAFLFSVATFACNKLDLGDEDFCGTYRLTPKTTFYKDASGQPAPFEQYTDVGALIEKLPTDDEMRSSHEWSLSNAPTERTEEEHHNVEVTGWIVAIKSHEDDRDYHVIVASTPDLDNATFMNVEVSGLPLDHADEQDFERARVEIQQVLNGATQHKTGAYARLDPPVKVTVKGSIFFDGDHEAGCENCPGPSFAKPSTVWEIHPVYSIKPAN